MYEGIITLISNVGFPIVVTLFFMFRIEKVLKEHNDILKELSIIIKGKRRIWKMPYDVKIAGRKTAKNWFIVMGIPMVLTFWTKLPEVLPEEWKAFSLPILGAISYAVKNYISNA